MSVALLRFLYAVIVSFCCSMLTRRGEQKRTVALISSMTSKVRALSGTLVCGAKELCKCDGGIYLACSSNKVFSRCPIARPASGVVVICGISGRAA